MSSDKLGKFLREVSNWQWDEFCKAEHDKTYTSNQAMIFALVRACSMQKMEAIKMSLNRLDGKLKTPIRLEFPKIYYLFPNATLAEGEQVEQPLIDGEPAHEVITHYEKKEVTTGDLLPPPLPETPPEAEDLPSMSLRETLTKMSDYPRELPEAIIALAQQTEWAMRDKVPMPEDLEIPRVKSVVAAHLLVLAQKRNVDALGEVFDQIDGKLVETIQVVGEDIYITSYSTVAPDGAKLNKDGVLEIEATQAQDLWAQKLGGAK